MDYIHGKITEFFNTLDWNDLPGNVRHEARRAVIDALGCLLAGLELHWGKVFAKWLI